MTICNFSDEKNYVPNKFELLAVAVDPKACDYMRHRDPTRTTKKLSLEKEETMADFSGFGY